MKKLVLLLAVAFSVSMFSCGNGDAAATADTTDTAAAPAEEVAAPAAEEAEVAVEEVTDSAATEAPAEEAAAPAAE